MFSTFAILTLTKLCLIQSLTFNEYKSQMQQIVVNLSKQTQKYYSQWCTNNVATCQTLSYNGCWHIRKTICNQQKYTDESCFSSGKWVSSASSVSFPPILDYQSLSHEDLRFVCSTAKLQKLFNQIEQKHGSHFSTAYISSKHGIFRGFPGILTSDDGICDDYEPRTRPWYTNAVSGAKNVIIIIDNSVSILEYFQDAKLLAETIVGTMSITDVIGVISFNKQTQGLVNDDNLLVGSNSNKQLFSDALSQLQISESDETNYTKGFMKALSIFNYTIASGLSGCSQAQNVIFLITDGKHQQNYTQIIQKMDTFINSKSSSMKRLILLSFIFGQSPQFLHNLTCHYNGMLLQRQSHFSSSFYAATQLQQFYNYLSNGLHITKPLWTQPYLDYDTGIYMVTASMPAYFTTPTNTKINVLIGVSGVDVFLSSFDQYQLSAQEISNKLIGEGGCQKSQLNACELQNLRVNTLRCNIANCTTILDNSSTCQKMPYLSVYTTDNVQQNPYRVCCGLTKLQFGLIVAGGSVFVIFVGVLLWNRRRILRKIRGNQYIKMPDKRKRYGRSPYAKGNYLGEGAGGAAVQQMGVQFQGPESKIQEESNRSSRSGRGNKKEQRESMSDSKEESESRMVQRQRQII